MVPNDGSTIDKCASGTYNSHFVTLGTRLVSRGLQDTVIRLAWEMNGSWFPGGFTGTTQTSWDTWKSCWIQIVTTMRGVSGSQFTYDFNPNIGYSESGTFFSSYYPGDAYVDVIALDVYDFDYNVCGASFTARWNNLLTQAGGLNDFATFADAHGKQMAFDEWGLWGVESPHCGGGDDPQFIDAMADWFGNHNVAWHSYFDVTADSEHRLDAYPNSKARYLARFGTVPATNTPVATATKTKTPVPGTITTYEAEAGTYGNGGAVQSASSASGGQVIGALNNVGAYSQVSSVNGGSGGSSTLVVRYANGYTTARTLSLYVNGTDVAQLSFPVTGSWNTFQDLSVTISLSAGTGNTLKLQRDSDDVAAADIDKYTVTVSSVGPTNTPVPPTSTSTKTPVPPTATNTPVSGIYDDEFTSSTLAAKWSWVRQDSANWSLSTAPGSMRITCQTGEINSTNTTAKNILLQSAPSGNWTVITKVTGKPAANWAQAGILVYQDDDNWLKVDRLYDSGNQFQIGKETAGTYTYTNVSDGITSTVSYLKIVKSGTNYSAYYSANGTTYTQVGATQSITLSTIKVGLICYGGTGLTADFDYFHLTAP